MKKKNILKGMGILLFLFQIKANAAPVISGITAPTSIGKYDKYEVLFNLGTYSNPYDPNVIDVSGEFTSPSGKLYKMNAFYYNQATGTCDANGYETVTLTTTKGWALRFAATETGTWTFRIKAIDGTGTAYSSNMNFTCNTSLNRGFISKKDTRYLKFDDGTNFYPVGNNIPWFDRDQWRGSQEKGTCQLFSFIDKLSANKANSARLEINYMEGLNIIGYDFTTNKNYLTYYNQRDCWQLDKIIDYAKTKDINLFLALFSHATLGDSDYCVNTWSELNPFNSSIPAAKKPQSPDISGPISNPFHFFTNASAIDIQKKLIRYIIARWGYATNIVSFELMDEADRTDVFNPSVPVPPTYLQDITNWHVNMKNTFNTLDPYKHLITTAFADNDASPYSGIKSAMDYLQIHCYRNTRTSPTGYDFEGEMYDKVTAFKALYNKPNYAGELGWLNGTSDYISYDPTFYGYHCALWANLFNGSMGAPAFWIHQDMLAIGSSTFFPYQGIGEFVKNFPINDQYVPSKAITNDFRMFLLSYINQDKYYAYVQDKNFAPKNVYSNHPQYPVNLSNRPSEGTNNYFALSVAKEGLYEVKWYNSETGAVYSTQSIASIAGTVTVGMPSQLRGSKYADAVVSVIYKCDGQFNSGVLNKTTTTQALLANDIDAYTPARDVFFVAPDNKIHVMFLNGYYWQEANLNPNGAGNVRANSDISVGPNGDVYFAATDNRIHKYYFSNNQWLEGAVNITNPQNVRSDSPILATGNNNIFFIATDNKPHVLWWDGTQFNDAVLNGSAPANARANTDLVMNSNGDLLFIGTDNRIHKYYYSVNQWLEATLNPGAPQNVRADSRLAVGPGNPGNIFFIATDNKPHYYRWIGSPTNAWQESAFASSPVLAKANSDIVSDKNIDKVYYVATDNRLHQYFVSGGQWVEAANNMNDKPNVAGNLTIDADNTIFYVGSDDKKIYSAYYGCNSLYRTTTDISEEENNLAQAESQLTIYPNPTNGEVDINFTSGDSNIQIEIFDIKGVQVINKQVLKGERKVHLDLSDLKNGMYILRVNDGKTINNSKLIKN